jgi:nitroreductase
MAICRRTVIFAAGGASLALIGAGGLFVATRTPLSAMRPWSVPGSDKPEPDIRLDAFRHAILAPNPHNRQPWLIRLIGDDQAVISCDLNRRLPETDPYDRQILIGFGCFLEITRMAAAERGVRVDIQAFPDGMPLERLDRRPVAGLRFVPNAGVRSDPLFQHILSRRSSKQPFDLARFVEPQTINELIALGDARVQIAGTNGPKAVATLRQQTWAAWEIEYRTHRTWMESVNLMRIGKAEIEANPDGIALGGPFLDALALAGQLSREQIAQPGTTAHTSSRDRYREIMATGQAYAWLVTDGNSRAEQLAAGRSYVRMHLVATRQGLGLHPVSQALQEYPEMAKLFADVHTTLGAKTGQRVQMLARLGYAKLPGPTPRWPLEAKLVRS